MVKMTRQKNCVVLKWKFYCVVPQWSIKHKTLDSKGIKVIHRGGGWHNTENAHSTDHSLYVYKDRNILFIIILKLLNTPYVYESY